jgi:hypothetical protein
MPQFAIGLSLKEVYRSAKFLRRQALIERGVLSRLDSNNPLVAELETENDMARAG